ncbi:MAG: SBBP repeat-containing protein, partial [Methylococcales bacterium]
GYDVFVTKFNAAGTDFIYSTHIGGSKPDEGRGIAVDSAGNAYVTGETYSLDFPVKNAFQKNNANTYNTADVFVTKLNVNGTLLVYSTYLGGKSSDGGYAIAIDSTGSAYVTGITRSTNSSGNFPVKKQIAGFAGTYFDAFVTKLNATGNALVYSSRLGGKGSSDWGTGIAVDRAGNAYVTGIFSPILSSNTFPTKNAAQATKGGRIDAFVTKINAAGSAVFFSTYLGGSSHDYGYGIAVNSAGNAFVTGATHSSNFPTVNPLFGIKKSNFDGFVAKFTAAGTALSYSTYLGGTNTSGAHESRAIAVDKSGNAYVTGVSSGAPIQNAFQPVKQSFSDAFISKLNATGTALVYSSYLGSAVSGYGIAVDGSGRAYVAGTTTYNRFPTMNALQPFYAGYFDAFVLRISP